MLNSQPNEYYSKALFNSATHKFLVKVVVGSKKIILPSLTRTFGMKNGKKSLTPSPSPRRGVKGKIFEY